MAKIIEERNERIDQLGTLLASIAQTQSKLESQEEGEDKAFPCKGLGYYLKLYFTDSELGEANLLNYSTITLNNVRDETISLIRH